MRKKVMVMMMAGMILLGGICLTILCFKDYRLTLVRPKNLTKYYVAFALFTLLNLAVYITLCSILLRIDPVDLKTSLNKAIFNNFQYPIPIIIAFTYFGIGAGSFKIGTFEFKFYSKLLDLFRNLFTLTDLRLEPPPQSENGRIRYEILRSKIIQLQLEAGSSKGWDKMESSWKQIEADAETWIRQIEELSGINEDLNVWPITEENIEKINRGIKGKVLELWDSVNLMLSRFVIDFIFTNIKDRQRVENELNSIGWLSPVETPVPSNPRSRVIGVGLITGLLFGIIAAFLTPSESSDNNPIVTMWCGAIAFTVFTMFYSRFYKITNIGEALLCGISGGFLGHFIWDFIRKAQLNYPENDSILNFLGNIIIDIHYQSLIIGALYGAVIAIILFSCRRCHISRLYLKYFLVTFCGALAFVGLHIILNLIHGEQVTMISASIFFVLGAIALIGLAYATDCFQGPRMQTD